MFSHLGQHKPCCHLVYLTNIFCSAVNALATSPPDYDEDVMANHIPASPASSVPPNSPGPSSSIKALPVSHVFFLGVHDTWMTSSVILFEYGHYSIFCHKCFKRI